MSQNSQVQRLHSNVVKHIPMQAGLAGYLGYPKDTAPFKTKDGVALTDKQRVLTGRPTSTSPSAICRCRST